MKGSEMNGFKLFMNADVITMDQQIPQADAFLVSGDRFVAVGSFKHIKDMLPTPVETIDLEGRAVTPGFIETHNHLCYYAMSLLNVDCSSATNLSIKDIQDKISDRARTLEPGDWLEGSNYDDTLI